MCCFADIHHIVHPRKIAFGFRRMNLAPAVFRVELAVRRLIAASIMLLPQALTEFV